MQVVTYQTSLPSRGVRFILHSFVFRTDPLMVFSPLIDHLIETLCCLPGVGPKSAQRIAFHLLERHRKGAIALSQALADSMNKVDRCQQCRTFTEQRLCIVCSDNKRDTTTICVVESPADAVAIEQSGSFHGLYFVLMGHLSPIDGIGPEDIGINFLLQRMRSETINEVILATNSTVEGEATAYYIIQQMKNLNVTVSRIAYGVPIGGELEYVDTGSLACSLSGRQVIDL